MLYYQVSINLFKTCRPITWLNDNSVSLYPRLLIFWYTESKKELFNKKKLFLHWLIDCHNVAWSKDHWLNATRMAFKLKVRELLCNPSLLSPSSSLLSQSPSCTVSLKLLLDLNPYRFRLLAVWNGKSSTVLD